MYGLCAAPIGAPRARRGARGGPRQDVRVTRLVRRGEIGERMARGDESAGAGEARPCRGVAEQCREFVAQRHGVAGRAQDGGAVGGEPVARDVRGEDRRPGRHGLEQDDPE